MDGRGKSCSAPVWFSTVVLMALVVHLAEAQDTIPSPDTTPPNVTCDDVTTTPFLPNRFLGLDEDVTYTYSDDNPDPSGISYNVSEGPGGDLFPPGRTPVTMFAVDTMGNMATCLFYVENQLTELPVNCLNVNQSVATDEGQPTYTYTLSFGVSDVTKDISGYEYHGDVSVDPTITVGSKLAVGTHPETVVISDEVLSKVCAGYVVVRDTEQPNVTCPADISENATNVIRFSADVTDNVGASLTYSSEPGSRFTPGSTMVSVTALDQAGFNDTCSFMVHVSLTELPVECPPDETIQISSDSTYQYPPMTKDNLTLTNSTYQFYGDVTIDMLINGTKNYTLSIGTYILTFQIDDTILNKTCSSVLIVGEMQQTPPRRAVNELPVECPPDETIQISSDSTYQYPPMTKDNLKLTDSTYQFYGDVTIDILVNGTKNYTLSIGTYILTFLIDDTILNKTCSSVLMVDEKQQTPPRRAEPYSTTVIVIVTCGVVLLVIMIMACCVCYFKKRNKRRKEKVNRSGGKDKYTKSSVV